MGNHGSYSDSVIVRWFGQYRRVSVQARSDCVVRGIFAGWVIAVNWSQKSW